MIKGVIFDMDGVMVDTERQSTKGWLAAAKLHKIEMPMWLINQFKGSPAHMSEKYFNDYFKGELNYWEMRNERTQYINKLRKIECTKLQYKKSESVAAAYQLRRFPFLAESA